MSSTSAIYIPSYNRSSKPLAGTLRNWPKKLAAYVVVRPQQQNDYKSLCEELGLSAVTVLPLGKAGIAKTRTSIVKHAQGCGHLQIVMVDDDLEFLQRRDDHEWKLRGATDKEIGVMFKTMFKDLTKVAHVAISCREGNNRVLEDSVMNTRGIRIVGYATKVLAEEKLTFSPVVEGREDLDMTLALLRKGYANKVYYKWAQGQGGSNTRGGLSGSKAREPERMKKTAEELAKRHPGCVRVVKKVTKESWGGGERWDVTCYWKKAYASSQPETKKK